MLNIYIYVNQSFATSFCLLIQINCSSWGEKLTHLLTLCKLSYKNLPRTNLLVKESTKTLLLNKAVILIRLNKATFYRFLAIILDQGMAAYI